MFERWIFINVNFHFSAMHSIGPVGFGYRLVIFARLWSRWVCIQVEWVKSYAFNLGVGGRLLVLYVPVVMTSCSYLICHIYLYAPFHLPSSFAQSRRRWEKIKKRCCLLNFFCRIAALALEKFDSALAIKDKGLNRNKTCFAPWGQGIVLKLSHGRSGSVAESVKYLKFQGCVLFHYMFN